MKKIYLKLGLCSLIATILGLTTHIYISKWTKPLIEQMARGLPPETGNYSPHIMLAAYGTAFVTLSIIVFLYYQTGHLLNISNRFLKSLIVAAIILEVKGGELFRQPFMDYIVYNSMGAKTSFTLVFLNHIDKWLSNLFIALCLVYFCPVKQKGAKAGKML